MTREVPLANDNIRTIVDYDMPLTYIKDNRVSSIDPSGTPPFMN